MNGFFTKLATFVSRAAGQPLTFSIMALSVLVWLVAGPIFHFSDTWQLIANTGTGLITFLMVFLIQNSQNRDGAAMQAKLDELLRAVDKARAKFIGLENLDHEQIELVRLALEKQAADISAKDRTAEDTVDRLLSRLKQ